MTFDEFKRFGLTLPSLILLSLCALIVAMGLSIPVEAGLHSEPKAPLSTPVVERLYSKSEQCPELRTALAELGQKGDALSEGDWLVLEPAIMACTQRAVSKSLCEYQVNPDKHCIQSADSGMDRADTVQH